MRPMFWREGMLMPVCRSAGDVLIADPRYHSNAVLDHIQRGEALKVWHGLSMEQAGRHSGRSTNLERALGGFDMFILHEHFGDMDEVYGPRK